MINWNHWFFFSFPDCFLSGLVRFKLWFFISTVLLSFDLMLLIFSSLYAWSIFLFEIFSTWRIARIPLQDLLNDASPEFLMFYKDLLLNCCLSFSILSIFPGLLADFLFSCLFSSNYLAYDKFFGFPFKTSWLMQVPSFRCFEKSCFWIVFLVSSKMVSFCEILSKCLFSNFFLVVFYFLPCLFILLLFYLKWIVLNQSKLFFCLGTSTTSPCWKFISCISYFCEIFLFSYCLSADKFDIGHNDVSTHIFSF